MASQSLYRKWRSQTFSDLVGQEAVVRTLLNAVRDGRLAHAYLFCGPRGTGKTSVARLLAKAVNCANPRDGEPCNECISCQEITGGRSPDVIEIDAASNTGVDNIRDLRESVGILGTGGHYKVYVVDECFAYGELVTLADGSKMPIGKVVETQWQGEVLSYNVETGQVEPKRIVRHMKKVPAIPTVRVTFDNNRSIVCTINHKFYTPEGQVCAGHLEPGQFVYTNRERITRHQRAVLMGAAIGDGNISLTGSSMRARLRLNHSIAQNEYLEYKMRLLGDLVPGEAYYQDGAGTYSKTGTYAVSTLSRPEIAQIHRDLYGPGGHKRISRAYLDQLDELGLALWYLDDGSLTTQTWRYKRVHGGTSVYAAKRSSLSTYCFTYGDVEEIRGWLRERWDIESGTSKTARGPVIWLTLPGTERLHQIIAPFAPPSMQYKLLPKYQGQFQMPIDKGEPSGLAVSVVRGIEPAAMPEYVYNIEVEDNHNYFVRDMLVANCHMLTVSAFNALLKTLEEPPPHVIFVLATTEAHKVLPTIVSRCQRFNFGRFTMRELVARLRHVAEGEGLELEPAAADLLARAAQGGMRDALSLLDQAMAFCGTRIDLERTRAMLGLADPGAIRRIIEHIAAEQSAEGLHLINEMVTNGADLRQLNAQLSDEWRALVLARAGADVAALMDRSEDEARDIAALAQRFSLEELTACARVFAKNDTPARGLPVPQLALELSFLECLAIKRNGGAPAAPQPRDTTQDSHPAPPPRAIAAPASVTPPPAAAPAPPRASEASRPTTGNDSREVGASIRTPAPAPAIDELDLAAIANDLDMPAPVAMPTSSSADPLMEAEDIGAGEPPLPPEPADDIPEDELFADDDTPAPYASDPYADWLGQVQSRWQLVKQVCKQKSVSVAALLNSARPVLVEPGDVLTLVLQADYQFHLDKLRDPKSRAAIEWALEQVHSTPLRVRMMLASGNGNGNGHDPSGPRGGNSGPRGGNGPSAPRNPGGLNGSGPSDSGGSYSGKNGNRQGTAQQPRPLPRDSMPPVDAGALAPIQPDTLPDDGHRAQSIDSGRNGNWHTDQHGNPGKNGNRFNGYSEPGAVRDATAAYMPANVTPIRPARAAAARPSTSLEDQVRADAVIQTLLQNGIELADVQPLEDDD